LKPDFAEAYNNLGIVLKELSRLVEAESSYRQAIAIKSDFAEAHSNLGTTLKEFGRSKEAEASYRQAIALVSDFAEAHYNLGICLMEDRHHDMALKEFELSDFGLSKSYLLKCSYVVEEESIFYERLDFLINQGEINAIVGSLICRSEIKYGGGRLNPFCNEPLQYVSHTDLDERCDFESVFIKTIEDLLTDKKISLKAQGLLTNGIQTAGNIFDLEKVSETGIESIIHAEIEKYRIRCEDSEEGFIRKWPASYSLEGWLVCMQSGGKLAPHMHEMGWISGSIYINVPRKSKPDSGNLVLCLHDSEHELEIDISQGSVIDVSTGSLCLFPSSLHHYTIPFEEKENRIVLAFDVIPKS
jgi:tetratricopeptide (TPR) repeat protein